MAASYHNITGELTQELIAAGKNRKISSITLTNIVGTNSCTVDLYIEKKFVSGGDNSGKYYVFKGLYLPIGSTFIHHFNFDNTERQFGLFIKLNKSVEETPAVDVIIK